MNKRINIYCFIILITFFSTGLLKYALVVILCGYLITSTNQFKFKNDIFIKCSCLYFIYIIFEIFSHVLYTNEYQVFLRNIIPRHLSALIVIYTGYQVINKYNYFKFISLFVHLAVLSSLLSILQFYELITLDSFYSIIYGSTETTYGIQEFNESNYQQVFYGFPGLFNNIILASYIYSIFLFPVLLIKNKYIKYIYFILIFYALFLTQVRSAIYSVVFLLILYMIYKRKFLIPASILTFIFIIFINYNNWNLRILDAKSSVRIQTLSIFYDYVSSFPLLGDRDTFGKLLSDYRFTTPHNIFLNSVVYGGLLGLIPIVLIKAFTLKFTLNKRTIYNRSTYVTGAMLICYFVNESLHNQSLVFGDPLYLLLFLVHTFNVNENSIHIA